MVASLTTRVEADYLDGRDSQPCTRGHVAGRGVCVVLVLALVVPAAAAAAYCCWRRCCRDTATRECWRSLPKHEGVSEKPS